MNESIYNHIGSFMLQSFFEYAPSNTEMHLYAENISSQIIDNTRLKIYDWNVSCKSEWDNFKSNNSKERKFAKKAFAFLHSMKNCNTDYLIWIDSDILFLKSFNEKIIQSTINKSLIGLFDQSYIEPGYSAESGYVILNCKHKHYNKFVATYENYYLAETKPDEIKHWWDGQVCMLAASKFTKHINNLSELRTEYSHTPLNSSPLAEYFIHCKGKKKNMIENKRIKNKIGL